MILSKFSSTFDTSRSMWTVPVVAAIASLSAASYVLLKVIQVVRKKRRDEDALKDIPGPPAHWLWGNLNKLPRGAAIYRFIEWSERYNSRFKIYSGPFLMELILTNPEDIKVIYNTAEPKDPFGYEFLRPWLGDGLLISRGQKWARNRRLLTPAFHFDILKPYQDAFSGCTNTLVDKWRGVCGGGWKSINIFDHISVMTLDSLMRCIFGIQTNFQIQQSKNPYITAVYDLADLVTDRLRFFPYHSDVIYSLSLSGFKHRRALRTVHGFTRGVIQQRRSKRSRPDDANKYKNFIDLLIECRDTDGNGLSDQEIQDEVDTFMFEGHDTTASGLSWCLYNMARHPHYQQKCRDEINSVLADRNTVTWEDLQNFPYLTMCIKESLRLHPPVPGTGRITTKPLTFSDGTTIPAGIWIGISISGCHHNPAVWSKPEVYDPERFTPENSKDRHSHAFIPFSAGPRNCIGQHFAMNELKTSLSLLLRHFEFLEDGSCFVEKTPEIVLRAKKPGMFLKIRPIT